MSVVTPDEFNLGLRDYQQLALSFAVFPPEHGFTYPALGLVNEAGEYAGKIKKVLRGDAPPDHSQLAAELGDVLWYLSACAESIGYGLDDIARMNLEKLADRKERGVLKGNGDNR